MQPAKKNLSKALSAISMAAAATIAARAAHAQVMITPFYGDDPTFTQGTGYNEVWISQDYAGNTYTAENITSASVQTVSMAVGDYLWLALDAVVTGATNPDAGKNTGVVLSGGKAGNTTYMQVQPANLGLSTLGTDVLSSDLTGSKLQPLIGAQAPGSPSYAEGYVYSAEMVLNTKAGNNTTGNGIPNWAPPTTPGDVEHSFGGVGVNIPTYGSNATINSNYPSGIQQLTAFAGTSATYSQATEFWDSLAYQAASNGSVTLTPQIVANATAYWSLFTPGTSSTPSSYQATTVYPSNVASLPVLVIQIGSGGHSIVSLTAGTSPATNYGSNVGNLTMVGHNGSYALAQTSVLSAQTTASVSATGWNPGTDEEIFGVDVLYNGAHATASQLATLVNAINGDGIAPASVVDASTSWIWSSPVAFPSQYNLYLDFPTGASSASDSLGIDLSTANDANLAGYTFVQVAAVPEPVSLGILALGGVGLMARRGRRKT